MRTLFIVISLLSTFYEAHSQENNALNIYPGQHGIVVNIGKEPASKTGEIKSYTIERRTGTSNPFVKVASILPVESLDNFYANFKRMNVKFPKAGDLSSVDEKSLFEYVQKGKSLSELGFVGSHFAVLAGFNLMWLDEDVIEDLKYQYRVTVQGADQTNVSEMITFKRNNTLKSPIYQFDTYSQVTGEINMYLFAAGKNRPDYLEVSRTELHGKQELIAVIQNKVISPDTTKYIVKDTTAMPNRIYKYSFMAKDIYGNRVLAPIEATAVTFDYLQMPFQKNINTSADSSGHGIRILWEMANHSLISKTELYRSENSLNGYEKIATLFPGQTSYHDNDVLAATPYFYYFENTYKMFDLPRKTSGFSGYFTDNRAAYPPVIKYFDALQSGTLINWFHPHDNTLGFFVYRGEQGSPLKQISDLIKFEKDIHDYQFIDKDSTLSGGKYYDYALKSYSTSHQYSPYSDIVTVRPQINIPFPYPPQRPDARYEKDKIIVTWEDSNDFGIDKTGYQIKRETVLLSSGVIVAVDSFFTKFNILIDSLAEKGKYYHYSVKTVSAFGVHSQWSEYKVASFPVYLPTPPASVTADLTKDGVLLSWVNPDQETNCQYEVFRYERGFAPVKLYQTKKSEEQFLDKTVVPNKLYFYYLRSITDDGISGEMSKEAVMQL